MSLAQAVSILEIAILLICLKFQRSDSEKARFMIFERGPRAFVDETIKLLRGFTAQDSSSRSLCQSASDFIDERVAVLSSLRYSLATFLAQVCFV